VLAIVEGLVAVDQLSEARRVLQTVDPLEARDLADTLERGSGEERGNAASGVRRLSSPSRMPW
jgi:hypothetical protein